MQESQQSHGVPFDSAMRCPSHCDVLTSPFLTCSSHCDMLNPMKLRAKVSNSSLKLFMWGVGHSGDNTKRLGPYP